MLELLFQYVLPGAIALPTAFVVARSALRKDEANAVAAESGALKELVTETAEHLMKRLAERVTDLEADVVRMKSHIEALESENRQLRTWAKRLTSQVLEAGLDPVTLAEANHHLGGQD